MPLKILVGLAGQVGDIAMATVAARQAKAQWPDSHITFAVGLRYRHVADQLVTGLPFIDAIHCWSGYDNWPDENDIDHISTAKYDLFCPPFPEHTSDSWYNHMHYIHETCMMLGLPAPVDTQITLGYQSTVVRRSENTITLSLYSLGHQEHKTLDRALVIQLCRWIKDRGLTPLLVGGGDPEIPGAELIGPKLTLQQAVDRIVAAKAHVTVDTALSWIASAYQVPTVGLYAINYPDMSLPRVVSHNPTNPHAIYLNKESITQHSLAEITATLEPLLS
jgi:ADP-heptose:LPS heptosyltransferase